MDKFGREDIEEFLRAVGRNLKEPFRIDLLGEAVAILKFGAKRGTGDIDLMTDIQPVIGAFQAAWEDTGLSIEVSTVSVYDVPYEFEGRMEMVEIPGLEKLQVYAPDRNDWALMKISRSLQKDIQDVIEVHERVGLEYDILLERFLTEMTHMTGNPRTAILDFVFAMKSIFGKEASRDAKDKISRSKAWQERLRETGLGSRKRRRR